MDEDMTPKPDRTTPSDGTDPQSAAIQAEVEKLAEDAIAASETGDFGQAVELWTKIIDTPDLPSEAKVPAYFNRALAKRQSGDTRGQIQDYTAIVEMHEAPLEDKAKACINRGRVRGQTGDVRHEIRDYTSVIKTAKVPPKEKAAAYLNRGLAKNNQPETEGNVEDYTAVIEMPEATPEQKAEAYYSRSLQIIQLGDTEGSIRDCTAVTNTPDIPNELKALAHSELGWIHYHEGRLEESIEQSQKAVDLDIHYVVIRNNLALALIASGQGASGLDVYKTLLATAENPDELGSTPVDDLTKAIEKYPDVPEFKTALDMVKARIAELRGEQAG